MDDVTWLGEARDGDYVALRVGRRGDELVAEWIGLGRLRVRRDGSSPTFEASPDADALEVEKLRRGSVRLFLRHLEGKLGLHASAVSIDGGAVVLVGASGDGKSTLAAALCARDAELLADDATAIDEAPKGWAVLPFEDAHWLDRASCSVIGIARPYDSESKGRIAASRVAAAAAPARAILVLEFASDVGAVPRMTRLAGVESAAVLVPMLMRFVVDEPAVQRRELDALAELVAAVPIYRLVRPRDLAYLDVTCDLVRQATIS